MVVFRLVYAENIDKWLKVYDGERIRLTGATLFLG